MELTEIYSKYYEKKVPQETFDVLINLDPTAVPDKKMGRYGKWILNLWMQGKLLEEDQYKVQEYLEVLVKHRFARGSGIDVCKCKNLPDLYARLKGLMQVQTRSEIEKETKVNGAEVLFRDSKWVVYHLKTWEASKLIGSGTQWCTASKNTRSYFDSYSSSGKLIIFINRENGHKYQYHKSSGLFNAEDRRLTSSSLQHDYEKQETREIENIVFQERLMDFRLPEAAQDHITGISLCSGHNSAVGFYIDGNKESVYTDNIMSSPGKDLIFIEYFGKTSWEALTAVFDKNFNKLADGLLPACYRRYSYNRSYDDKVVYKNLTDNKLYYINEKQNGIVSMNAPEGINLNQCNLSLTQDRKQINSYSRSVCRRYATGTGELKEKRIILNHQCGFTEEVSYNPVTKNLIKTDVYSCSNVETEVTDPVQQLRYCSHEAWIDFKFDEYEGEEAFFLYTNAGCTDVFTESVRLRGLKSGVRSIRAEKDNLFFGKATKLFAGYPSDADHRFILVPDQKSPIRNYSEKGFLLISPYGWSFWDGSKQLKSDTGWCKANPGFYLESPYILKKLVTAGDLEDCAFDASTKIDWFDQLWKNLVSL